MPKARCRPVPLSPICAPRRRRGVVGIGLPFRLADEVADLAPDRRLGDEVDVGIRVVLPALALEDAPGLPATGIVARTRDRIAERDALAVLAVFRERSMLEALLVAHLHAGEVQHAVLHRAGNTLALARHAAMIERRDDAKRQMQAGTRIADLRAGDEGRPSRKPVVEAEPPVH